MRAKDIKPGQVLAFKDGKYGHVRKVRVLEASRTVGSTFSWEKGPQSGWAVEPIDFTPNLNNYNKDEQDRLVALGRDLLSTWDEFEAEEAARKERIAAEAVRAQKRREKQDKAAAELKSLSDDIGLDLTIIYSGQIFHFTAIELLALLEKARTHQDSETRRDLGWQ